MHVPLTIVVAIAAAASTDATRLTLSAPAAIVELDMGKLKGEPSRLAWSPDARQLYLQTLERSKVPPRMRHYVLALDGQPPKPVEQEPPWAATYWAWKSAQAAPGLPAFSIAIDQQQKRMTTTSTPTGGELARGGTSGGGEPGSGIGVGVGSAEASMAAVQSQTANVVTLRLKGEVIGEFINRPLLPGFTFGWAPAGSGLIAFASQAGPVVVMDDQGRKQPIAAKGTLLPAWTDDGKRLAYLEKGGRKKIVLMIVDVTRPAP